VRINDRGPFHDDRIIDLSYAAAVRLGGPSVGTQLVDVELLQPDEIAGIRAARLNAPPTEVATNTRPGTSTSVDVPAALVAPVSMAPVSTAPVSTPPASIEADANSPNPTATTTAGTSGDPSAGVAIQVGAYSLRANAQTTLDRIARDLPDLASRATVVLREGIYRVRVGPYADPVQAVADQQRLRDQFTEATLVTDAR
jgi:rare lipoprotein A